MRFVFNACPNTWKTQPKWNILSIFICALCTDFNPFWILTVLLFRHLKRAYLLCACANTSHVRDIVEFLGFQFWSLKANKKPLTEPHLRFGCFFCMSNFVCHHRVIVIINVLFGCLLRVRLLYNSGWHPSVEFWFHFLKL